MLKNPPEPQKVSVIVRNGDAVLVWRFQRAPQAECPSITRGSLDALSKKIARVGETTIASSARMPLVPFWTNSHPAAMADETPVDNTILESRPNRWRMFELRENAAVSGESGLLAFISFLTAHSGVGWIA